MSSSRRTLRRAAPRDISRVWILTLAAGIGFAAWATVLIVKCRRRGPLAVSRSTIRLSLKESDSGLGPKLDQRMQLAITDGPLSGPPECRHAQPGRPDQSSRSGGQAPYGPDLFRLVAPAYLSAYHSGQPRPVPHECQRTGFAARAVRVDPPACRWHGRGQGFESPKLHPSPIRLSQGGTPTTARESGGCIRTPPRCLFPRVCPQRFRRSNPVRSAAVPRWWR